MKQAEIITGWSGDGTTDSPNRPMISDTFQVKKWEDVTGQSSNNLHPDPNTYILHITCEDDVLTQIEADSDYYVLWEEPIVEDEFS